MSEKRLMAAHDTLLSVSFLVAKLLRLHISVQYHLVFFFPRATYNCYKDKENIENEIATESIKNKRHRPFTFLMVIIFQILHFSVISEI